MLLHQSETSDSFEVHEGTRQGDPFSPILFNFVLENTLAKAKVTRESLIYNKQHQCLILTVNLVVVMKSQQELMLLK